MPYKNASDKKRNAAQNRKIRIAKGICVCCPNLTTEGKTLCDLCKPKRAESLKRSNKKRIERPKKEDTDIYDDDKGEYIMTEEERRQFNKRWNTLFSQSFILQQEIYIFRAKDMYDGYSNK